MLILSGRKNVSDQKLIFGIKSRQLEIGAAVITLILFIPNIISFAWAIMGNHPTTYLKSALVFFNFLTLLGIIASRIQLSRHIAC